MQTESQHAITSLVPRRSSYFIKESNKAEQKANFQQAKTFSRCFNTHFRFSQILHFTIWQEISSYLMNLRVFLELLIYILAVGSLFSVIPVFYNYFSHNLGTLTGYRFGAAVTSLAAPLDINILRQLLLTTLPDIFYTFFIGIIVLYIKFKYVVISSHTQKGIRSEKNTSAVRLTGFKQTDQQIINKLCNPKQICPEFQYKGTLKTVYDSTKKIESLKQLRVKGASQNQILKIDQQINNQTQFLNSLPRTSVELTDRVIITFQKDINRTNFVKLMKLNGRTTSLIDKLFGSLKEDKQIFGNTKLRLSDEYIDQPALLYPQVDDNTTTVWCVRTIVFILLFLLLLFFNFAIVSLPMAIGVKNPATCTYPTKFTLNNIQNATVADKYCFCANNEYQFFTTNYNSTFFKACNSSLSYVLMSEDMLVLSSVANIGINLLTSYIVPFLATSLLLFGSAYTRQTALFYLSLIAQLWNLIILPLLINARFDNFRPINTINFMLQSVKSTNTAYNDFTRLWFSNMSVWFVTNLLLLLAVPWLKLLFTFIRQTIRQGQLETNAHFYNQLQLNQLMQKDSKFSVAEILSDITATVLFALFFCSGMPILLPICFLDAIMHFAATHIRIFRLQARGYLPPAKFYSNLARTVFYFLFVHIVIGCYMYGNILDCSGIFKNPSNVFDRKAKIIAPIHVSIFALLFIGFGILLELLTQCLACDIDSQSQQRSSQSSYSIQKIKKYQHAIKYFYFPSLDSQSAIKLESEEHYEQVIPVISKPLNVRSRQKDLKSEKLQSKEQHIILQ